MPSLTRLTAVELLTQAIQFVADQLALCGYTVCSTQRTHDEPTKIPCCDCGPASAGYSVYGWIMRSFQSDGALNEIQSLNCPTFDALQIGFSVARCWPLDENVKEGGKRDAAAAELALVLDCLRDAFGDCVNRPALFHVEPSEEIPDPAPQLCTRMLVNQFISDRDDFVTPYAESATIRWSCAGWKWSITIA